MGDLSIEQIKLKANQARDLFGAYIDNLVNAGESRKASDTEIELFKLNGAYGDKRLSTLEGDQIKASINNLNFDFLINTKAISFIQNEKRFSVTSGYGDINNDGQINNFDMGAINYVLNFTGDKIENLENVLNMAGNQDKITEFYVKRWAAERGMVTGSEQYNKFFDKFYNDLYKQATKPMDVPSLQKVLRMYDVGLGKNNIDDIDAYLPAINADIPFTVVLNLYSFENSTGFDVSSEQKPAKRNSYINILSGSNTDLKRVLTEALTRKSVPISGKELKVSNLDEILAITGDEKATNRYLINQWADQRKLTGDAKDIFFNKFYNTFYKAGEANGLKLPVLKNLLEIYDDFKKTPGVNFEINKLDIYAQGLKQGIPIKSLSLILKFEKTSAFDLNPTERLTTMEKYFEILAQEKSDIQTYFLQALRYNQIPFTKEPLTPRSLDEFLNKISAPDGIIDLTIDSWAKERNLVNIASSQTDDYDVFCRKLKEYFTRGLNVSNLKTIVSMFDKEKMPISELGNGIFDVYVTGLKDGLKPAQVYNILKFERSSSFEISDPAIRLRTIEKYLGVLKSGTNDEKDILEKTLVNGKKVFLTNDDISVANIDKILNALKEPYGYALIQFDNLAKERNLSSTDKEIFINKLKDWHINQTPPKINYQLSVGEIGNLIRIYDQKKLSLDQLDIYAKALKDKVSYKVLENLYKFETGDIFKSQANDRETRLQSYINIFKGSNKEKSQQLLNAFKTGKLPVTEEEINLLKLDEIIAKYDDPKLLAELYIDTWARKRPNTTEYRNKFLSYYNDENFKLSASELMTLKSLYESNTNIDINKLDQYALAIKAKVNFKNLSQIYKLNVDPRAAGKQDELDRYIGILKTGSKNQQTVLNQALSNNNIPYINTKFKTEREIYFKQLDDVLELVKDENNLNEYVIKNWAKEIGLRENTTDYVNFVDKFYKVYWLEQKINMSDIRTLQYIYSSKEFDYPTLDKMANAIKQGLSSSDINKLVEISKKNNFTVTSFERYLNILIGREGEVKKKIILDMIRSNRVPFTDSRI